jgi:hypothetical protein
MSTPSTTELRPRVPGVSPTTTRLLSRAVPSSLPSSVGLVVDDEPQVAVVLNDVLTTLGYVVQVTETGAGDRSDAQLPHTTPGGAPTHSGQRDSTPTRACALTQHPERSCAPSAQLLIHLRAVTASSALRVPDSRATEVQPIDTIRVGHLALYLSRVDWPIAAIAPAAVPEALVDCGGCFAGK